MNHRIRVNGLTIGWMDTPGEDRIMKTYHGAKDGWLTQAEEEPAVRAPAQAGRGRARGGLSLERGKRADDGLDHRLRPAGAGRHEAPATPPPLPA